MLKFLAITTICVLATASQSDDRLTKLERMVAEQQAAMEELQAVVEEQWTAMERQEVSAKERGVVMQEALEEIEQLKHKLSGINSPWHFSVIVMMAG